MSADLSDPAITSGIDSINDPVSPISWLALSYHPTAARTLSLVSTGFDPWVPRWQEVIQGRKEPMFGYGLVGKGRPMREGGEKGVVLVYLPEDVTGVRRARAVVHSRTLANKFPDYSAIITISDPSQITEDFVRSQVNFYNQPVPTPTSSPVKPRTPAQLGLGHPNGPQVRSVQTSSSSTRSMDRPLPPPPPEPVEVPNPAPTSPRAPSPTTPRRKDSLSSRFANAVRSGKTSPRSPNRSTFESLTSGFGKGRKEVIEQGQQSAVMRDGLDTESHPGMTVPDGLPETSRTAQRTAVADTAASSGANALPSRSPSPPPLPPKAPALNRLHTLGPVVEPLNPSAPPHSGSHITPFPLTSQVESSIPVQPAQNDTQIPPDPHAFPMSPTASAALHSVREKQVYAETRQHEEFRRTEERRRVNSGPREDPESEDGLPYDRDDPKGEVLGKRRGLVLATITGSDTDDDKKHSPPPVYASRVDLGRVEASDHADQGMAGRPNGSALKDVQGNRNNSHTLAKGPKLCAEELEEIRRMEERRVLEEAERRRQVEEERTAQAEQKRLEQEEQGRQAVEECRREAERIEAERQVEAERLEAERVEAERLEAERQAERLAEERLAQAKLAEARARKDMLRAELHQGKSTGGKMLQGHVTVQTTKSVTWRRRHFQLFPSELWLLKTDTDTTPIQTIPLAGAQVTETYEESQVQGSFKIIGQGEDFFLFSDSTAEREELLEGLSVALG